MAIKPSETVKKANIDNGESPFPDPDAFLFAIRDQYQNLSRQLKVIARYIETAREQLSLHGVQETAARCGVQPSALVRFAKHFGFSGYSEMQALFRAGAVRRLAAPNDYENRIRELAQTHPVSPALLAHEVIGGCMESLETLRHNLPEQDFDQAVNLMLDAPSLWLVAARRAFPIAAYLNYALQFTGKPIHWVNGLGHMQIGQMRALKDSDVVIAISFEPYASETMTTVRTVRERGAKLIAITDSSLSPLVPLANVSLLVHEGATFGFRSLTSTHCLAQSLFLGLAYRMQLAH